MLPILMPVCDEGEINKKTVRERHEAVVSQIPDCELMGVNDSTKDDKLETPNRRENWLSGIRAVTPPQSGGHRRALRFGFMEGTKECVFQTESDRQHILADFWKLWELKDRNDFGLGDRSTRAGRWTRFGVSICMKIVNVVQSGIWSLDANGPFKLERRDSEINDRPRTGVGQSLTGIQVGYSCTKQSMASRRRVRCA